MAFLAVLKARAEEEGLPLRVVLKESLQVYALAALYGLPEAVEVIFQGGTCLRLAYGGPRYSEDLDSVTRLPADSLANLFPKVESDLTRLEPLFDGAITLRQQKQSKSLTRWRLTLAGPGQRESASISLEFGAFPAYTSQPVALNLAFEYPGLPLVVVRAETLPEIMADKIVALSWRSYLKARDVFDLWYLHTRGVSPPWELVERKLKDYDIQAAEPQARLAKFTPARLRLELENFLPRQQRAVVLAYDGLQNMLAEVHTLLAHP